MKNKIKNIGFIIGLFSLMFVACKDKIDPIVENLQFNRVFTPLNLKTQIRNMTTVELTWDTKEDADSYVLEISEDSLSFTHIIKTLTVTADELPYSVLLDGQTQYSARVKGTSNNGLSESKWANVVFKTAAENIFMPLSDENIEATSVTLNWPAGSEVTHFIITPGNVNRAITEQEIADGMAVITGLTGEVDYTVTMFKGAKQRGSVTFKTSVDLGGSTPVYEGDDLVAKLNAAVDGESFVLFPGTYTVGDYAITKSIAIKGLRPSEKPVVVGRFTFGVDLTSVVFSNINLNGSDASTYSNPLQFTAAVTVGLISFDRCLINNYKSHFFYDGSKGATLGEFKLTNSIVDNIVGNGGDGFDFRTSCVRKLTYSNTTFSNGFRTFIRLDYTGALSQEVSIDHCTFYRVCSFDNSNNVGLLRVNGTGAAHTVSITNSVLYDIGGDTSLGFMSKGKISSTTTVTLKSNDYFASPQLWTNSPFVGVASDFDSKAMELDPGFVDAANGDFTLTNQTLIDNNIGDPRWIP